MKSFITLTPLNSLTLLTLLVFSCSQGSDQSEPVAEPPVDSTEIVQVITDTDTTPAPNPFAQQWDSTEVDTNKYTRNRDGYIELSWLQLKKVKWDERFNEEVNAYIAYPIFHPEVLYLEGKKVQIRGYVIPTEETEDETLLVLSAFPYSNCFFCGGAGPESVMDIKLKKKSGRFEQDDQVTFRGQLRLNDSDLYYLNYILEDAELVD